MNDPIEPRPFEPEELDEHAVYRVSLMHNPNNPPHAGILIMGFHNGSYCKLTSPGLPETHPSNYHAIEVHEKLCDLPDTGPFEDAEALTFDNFTDQWDDD